MTGDERRLHCRRVSAFCAVIGQSYSRKRSRALHLDLSRHAGGPLSAMSSPRDLPFERPQQTVSSRSKRRWASWRYRPHSSRSDFSEADGQLRRISYLRLEPDGPAPRPSRRGGVRENADAVIGASPMTGSVEGIVSEPPASEKAKTTGRLGISAMTPSAKLRFRTRRVLASDQPLRVTRPPRAGSEKLSCPVST